MDGAARRSPLAAPRPEIASLNRQRDRVRRWNPSEERERERERERDVARRKNQTRPFARSSEFLLRRYVSTAPAVFRSGRAARFRLSALFLHASLCTVAGTRIMKISSSSCANSSRFSPLKLQVSSRAIDTTPVKGSKRCSFAILRKVVSYLA